MVTAHSKSSYCEQYPYHTKKVTLRDARLHVRRLLHYPARASMAHLACTLKPSSGACDAMAQAAQACCHTFSTIMITRERGLLVLWWLAAQPRMDAGQACFVAWLEEVHIQVVPAT